MKRSIPARGLGEGKTEKQQSAVKFTVPSPEDMLSVCHELCKKMQDKGVVTPCMRPKVFS